jgi:hypothetical protein
LKCEEYAVDYDDFWAKYFPNCGFGIQKERLWAKRLATTVLPEDVAPVRTIFRCGDSGGWFRKRFAFLKGDLTVFGRV